MLNLPAFDPNAPLSQRGSQPVGYGKVPCLALANSGWTFEVFCKDPKAPSRKVYENGVDTGKLRHAFFARISNMETGQEELSAFSTAIQDALHADYEDGEASEDGSWVWEPSIVLDPLDLTRENYHPNGDDGLEDETQTATRLRIINRSQGVAIKTIAAKSAIAH